MRDIKKTAPDEVRHFFMAAGNIIYKHKTEEGVGAIACNCIVNNKDGKLPLSQIARVQQTLQAQFHQRVNDVENLQILDVVLISIIPLGRFTNEEFNRAPEGTKQVEHTATVGNA